MVIALLIVIVLSLFRVNQYLHIIAKNTKGTAELVNSGNVKVLTELKRINK